MCVWVLEISQQYWPCLQSNLRKVQGCQPNINLSKPTSINGQGRAGRHFSTGLVKYSYLGILRWALSLFHFKDHLFFWSRIGTCYFTRQICLFARKYFFLKVVFMKNKFLKTFFFLIFSSIIIIRHVKSIILNEYLNLWTGDCSCKNSTRRY